MANNTTSCEVVLLDSKFVAIAAVRAAVGTISAIACVGLVALILLLKKYKHSLCQRLILYLAIAAFFHSLSYPLARVNYYSARRLLSSYCMFSGFLNLYTSWAEVVALSCLTIGSFMNGFMRKVQPRKAEYIYIALPYTLPWLWCWIPFIDHAFGSGSSWCDIRTVNPDCQPFVFGIAIRFIIWYFSLTAVLVFLFIFALYVFFQVKRKQRSEMEMQEWEKDDLKQLKHLIFYPLVYLVLNTFSLINRIDIAVQGEQAVIPLYYLHILTSPFRGLVIAVVFLFDPYTLKRLARPKSLCHDTEVSEYPMEHSERTFSSSVNNHGALSSKIN